MDRNEISKRFICGSGLEIGAGQNPFPLIHGQASAFYVDKWDKNQLIDGYNLKINHDQVVEANLIDDGQTLSKIADGLYNFVLSSHQFEHCESPLTALQNHLRVLQVGGVLFYAIPDKSLTFDRNRESTLLSHLIENHLNQSVYQEDPELRVRELLAHYHDYLLHVDKILDPKEREKIALDRISKNYDIHYHCWDYKGIQEIFQMAYDYVDFKYQIEHLSSEGAEALVVLRKC